MEVLNSIHYGQKLLFLIFLHQENELRLMDWDCDICGQFSYMFFLKEMTKKIRNGEQQSGTGCFGYEVFVLFVWVCRSYARLCSISSIGPNEWRGSVLPLKPWSRITFVRHLAMRRSGKLSVLWSVLLRRRLELGCVKGHPHGVEKSVKRLVPAPQPFGKRWGWIARSFSFFLPWESKINPLNWSEWIARSWWWWWCPCQELIELNVSNKQWRVLLKRQCVLACHLCCVPWLRC